MQRVECFGWCFEAEAFSGCVVVVGEDGIELLWEQLGGIYFGGEGAPKAADGVFDAAFLPRRSRIAEVGMDAELAGQQVVAVEFAAIVEGDGLAQFGRERFEQAGEAFGDGLRPEAWLGDSQGNP